MAASSTLEAKLTNDTNNQGPQDRQRPSGLFPVRANPLFKRGDDLLDELARCLVG
jgi:hypothetical protein